MSGEMSFCYSRAWVALLENLAQFGAKFWAVRMLVNRDRVLYCGLQQFFIAVSDKRERTVHFTWELPAIDVNTCHTSPPSVDK